MNSLICLLLLFIASVCYIEEGWILIKKEKKKKAMNTSNKVMLFVK